MSPLLLVAAGGVGLFFLLRKKPAATAGTTPLPAAPAVTLAPPAAVASVAAPVASAASQDVAAPDAVVVSQILTQMQQQGAVSPAAVASVTSFAPPAEAIHQVAGTVTDPPSVLDVVQSALNPLGGLLGR